MTRVLLDEARVQGAVSEAIRQVRCGRFPGFDWMTSLMDKLASTSAVRFPEEVPDLLALIAAQFLRYKGAQLFCFDKGRSMLPLTLACGGNHYDVAAPDSPLLFCPLSMVESDADQAWAEDWLATMIQLQGVTLNPSIRNELHRAMALMRSSAADRSISSLIHTLQSKELREALRRTRDG